MSKVVLAAASYYNQKYYFSDKFNGLSPEIKKEIREIIITAAEKSKGVFSVSLDEAGKIYFETGGLDGDLNYDEIEGKMQINKIEKNDLFKKIALYYSCLQSKSGSGI